MDNKIEIILSASTAIGEIELYGNEPINLDMSVADIKDISKTRSTYSQTFQVPATRNNNILFNNIFEINADSSFNAAKKVNAQIFVNTIPPIENSVLQLTEIIVENQKPVSYECVIFSEVSDLITRIGEALIEDLNYSELNHSYSYSAITNSWTSSTLGYLYPLMDNGQDYQLSTLNVKFNRMWAATKAKVITDKIFSGVGKSYTSTFFNSDYFKNYYVPFNGNIDFTQDLSFSTGRTFAASPNMVLTGKTGSTMQLNSAGSTYTYSLGTFSLPFTNDYTAPNFDNGNLYLTSGTGSYSSDTYSKQNFVVNLDFNFSDFNVGMFSAFNIGTKGQLRVYFYRSSYSSTAPYNIVTIPITSPETRQQKQFNSGWLDGVDAAKFYPAQPNEIFTFKIFASVEVSTPIAGSSGFATFNLFAANSYWLNEVATTVTEGQMVNYSIFVPKKIKQIDFLKGIFLKHNLYIDTDRDNSNRYIIETRDVYYSGGTTHNWSNKLDVSQKITETLLSEQVSKKITFSDKDDKDYYNTQYKSLTNRIYGDYIFTVDNDFTKDEQKIETVFSPTPMDNVRDTVSFIIPKVGSVDSNGTYGKTDFNIRLLQKNFVYTNSGETWNLLSGINSTAHNFNYYVTLSHLDHPFTGSTDCNFGTILTSFYGAQQTGITQNNLVNRYWKNYLDQISDKNSKQIVCYVYLTATDINSFRFCDTVYIEGVTTDAGAYYIVNKINYSPTANRPSKVELIKLKNVIGQTFFNKPIQSVSWGNKFKGGLTLGDAVNYGSGSIANGNGTTIGIGSAGSVAVGNNNTVQSFGSSIISGARNSII